VLVLLLALLVPGARAELHAAPSTAVSGEIVEYDVPDAALRPPVGIARLTAVPLRPAPLQAPVPAGTARSRCGDGPAGSPDAPGALHALRSVVLRC
jgi:hypothetical protein